MVGTLVSRLGITSMMPGVSRSTSGLILTLVASDFLRCKHPGTG